MILIAVTLYRRRRDASKSREFNFSLHAKINHIEFEDRFMIKSMRMYNIFCEKTVKKFLTNMERKKRTLNDFLRMFGTIGSTERTVVSGRPFCAIFSFTRCGKVKT